MPGRGTLRNGSLRTVETAPVRREGVPPCSTFGHPPATTGHHLRVDRNVGQERQRFPPQTPERLLLRTTNWIIETADAWWGGPITSALPRLFLDHFHPTSVIAESSDQHVGFLVGFLSPADSSAAYIHFAGVDPSHRRHAVGRRLDQHFFALARAAGRSEVTAITSSLNQDSIRFHPRSWIHRLRTSAELQRPKHNAGKVSPSDLRKC